MRYKKYIRALIIVISFLYSTTYATIVVSSTLQSMYEKIKNNPTSEKLPGGKVEDLYFQALQNIKENEFTPYQESLTQIRTEINKTYQCNIEDTDILNIVLSSPNSKGDMFTLQLLFGEKLPEGELYIDTKDFIESCNTLMLCVKKEKSQSPHTACIDTIQKSFAVTKLQLKEQNEMRMGNYGKDFFHNGDPEDAPFDLLVDIQMVGDVLFTSFKPAEEAKVLFYKMPEIDTPIPVNDTFLPKDGAIYPGETNPGGSADRFFTDENGNLTEGFQCPQNMEAATSSFDPPSGGGTSETNNDDTIDPELGNFTTTTTNTTTTTDTTQNPANNPAYIEGIGNIGNICISPEEESPTPEENEDSAALTGEEAEPPEDTTPTTNPRAITDIPPSCGNNTIEEEEGEQCDNGDENNTNGECLPNCKIAKCGDGYIEAESETCDDGNTQDYDCCDSSCQNENVLSPEDMFLGDMLSSLDALGMGTANKITNECFPGCKELPFKERIDCIGEGLKNKCGDLQLKDKVLCMTECSCNQISSPEFASIQTGALSIRRCLVPAEPVEVKIKNKTVFSIEEVLTTLHDLLASMRDSGKLVKRIETKEMLEISLLKNDFSKMFAFNLVVNFKPLVGGARSKSEIEKQAQKEEEILQASILNIQKDPSLISERNKYITSMNIAAYKAGLKGFESIEELQVEIQAEQEKLSQKTQIGNSENQNTTPNTPTETEQTQTLTRDSERQKEMLNNMEDRKRGAEISEEFLTFLEMNHSFRQELNNTFMEIYGASQLLNTKISGK